MRCRWLIFVISVLSFLAGYGKTKTVEGESIFYIPSTMNRAQAEEEAIRWAKINALNKAFGNSLVFSQTTILTENDERFYSNGFDLVKGEWIETIGKPEIKVGLDGSDVFLTVKIKGKAREKKSADTDLSVKILRNCTTPNCEASQFRNGDKIFVRFESPIDGYVSIYQYDPVADAVYCLLPYKKDGSGSVRVEHDKEYVFFSKSRSDDPRMVDEYRLGCDADGEVNTIFILFSPNKFSRSATESSGKFTPRSLPFKDFDSWKARSQAQDAALQVVSKNIIIDK